MTIISDEELKAAMKNSRDRLKEIVNENGWTVAREYTDDVPSMGLPCSMLGPWVYTVKDANGILWGYSQLSDDIAIARAMIKYRKAKVNLS